MKDHKKKLGVVGLSHLGLVWSIGYAHLGFDVVGFDSDHEIVSSLKQGVVLIQETDLTKLFHDHRSNLTFISDPSDLHQCSVIYFAKDVPMDEEGRIDLEPIDTLINLVIPHLPPHVEFIFMGQVPVGYTRKLSERIRTLRPDFPFRLIYCVETISVGSGIRNFLNRQYTLLGTSDQSDRKPSELIEWVLKPFRCETFYMSYESAELTKGGMNILLASHLSFVNLLSDFCEKFGGNIHEIIAAMKLDRRFSLYSPWRAGIGFAGGHFERDLSTWLHLAEQSDIKQTFLKAIVKYNKERYQWLVQKLEEAISTSSKRPEICLWGLSYKKGTDSTHNAHCLRIIRDFGSRANLRAYDPIAKLPSQISNVCIFRDKFDALRGADCLIVLTEWDEFSISNPSPFLELMRRPVVIDCVNVLPPKVTYDKRIICFTIGSAGPDHG